jgi:uncharacterized membrane protein
MTSPDNPYRPPTSPVADMPEPGAAAAFAVPGRTVDAGRGGSWIGEGWALFKAAPLLWIVAVIIVFGIQVLINMVPLLGSIAAILLGPAFMVGSLAFGQGVAETGEADVARLFAGFRDKLGPLVMVALVYLLMIVAVMLVTAILGMVLLGGANLANVAHSESALMGLASGAAGLGFLILLLVMLGLFVLVAAAYWFAPGLVFYTGIGAVDAMKQSFSACMRNWLPFLVYGILGFLLILVGSLPFGLGLFVVLPLLMASYYTCFRDIFGANA